MLSGAVNVNGRPGADFEGESVEEMGMVLALPWSKFQFHGDQVLTEDGWTMNDIRRRKRGPKSVSGDDLS